MVISDIYFVNVTADQPLSENSTAQWRGVGCGMGWVQADSYQNIFGNIRTYATKYLLALGLSVLMRRHASSCRQLLLCLLFFLYFKYFLFHKGLASIHRFINRSLRCKEMCLDNGDIKPLVSHQL